MLLEHGCRNNLFKNFLSVLLGTYPEVELLDSVVVLFLIF